MSLYRRLLTDLQAAGATHVYSHQLARLAGVTAAQVRRDLMAIGYSGSPHRGYELEQCLTSIGSFLDGSGRRDVVLVGVGRLGQSILAHFSGHRPLLRIVAAFDTDATIVGTAMSGCHCYSVDTMEDVVRDLQVRTAILAVPADHAQAVAATLVRAGIRSIVSFAQVPLRVPDDIFVDYVDITTALESAAYFARDEVRQAAPEESSGILRADSRARDQGPLLARTDLNLADLAAKIGASVLTPGRPGAVSISKVYAGDRVSDLLNEASAETLLVTNLASVQMLRVAELMDVPGVCFVESVTPDATVIEVARANQTFLMVSPGGVYETCGLLYAALASAAAPEEN